MQEHRTHCTPGKHVLQSVDAKVDALYQSGVRMLLYPILTGHGHKTMDRRVIFRGSSRKKNDHIISINLFESVLNREVKEISFVVSERHGFD